MRKFIVAACMAGTVVAGGPTAHAGQPVFERVTVDESGLEPFMTDACGFDVAYSARGSMTFRFFADRTKGVQEVKTLNVAYTLSANGNEYRFRDVGADAVRVAPDGTMILSIIGQIPFGFTGVVKLNLDTFEIILEPHHDVSGDIEEACAVLAG